MLHIEVRECVMPDCWGVNVTPAEADYYSREWAKLIAGRIERTTPGAEWEIITTHGRSVVRAWDDDGPRDDVAEDLRGWMERNWILATG